MRRSASRSAPALDPRTAQFRALLKERLRLREMARGRVYALDLRHATFAALPNKRITLFDPASPGWPREGATTDDRDTAERWIDQQYAVWLERELATEAASATTTAAAGLTVDTVRGYCEAYLKELPSVLGSERHNTFKNHRSALRNHVIPAIGDVPLRAMNQARLRTLLLGLRVHPRGRQGREPKRAASPKTGSNVTAAFQAVWKWAFPDDACPFKYDGKVYREHRARERAAARDAIIAGRVRTVKKSYTYDDLELILLTGTWYDRMVLRLPCMRGRYQPVSAELIACSTGLGTRISELPLWRWSHIRPGGTILPGLKTEASLRVAPLQETMEPWLARLEPCTPDCAESQIFRLSKSGENTEHTGKKLYGRIANILLFAGLKLPGQATHIFRETFATMARSRPDLIDPASLKQYLGHSDVYGGVTDDYLDLQNLERLIANIPDAHRQFVRLPAPEALEARLRAGWVPATYRGGTLTEELQRLRGNGEPSPE